MKKLVIFKPVIHLSVVLTFCVTSITFADDYISLTPTNSYPQDLINVYEAIWNITPGGIIHLEEGTFDFGWEGVWIYKSCTFEGELNSEGKSLTTIIDGSFNPTIGIVSGGVVVKNLKIENTYYYGSSIWIEPVSGDQVIIDNNILKSGYGIHSNYCGNSEITIINNRFLCHRGIQIRNINGPIKISGNTIETREDVYYVSAYALGIELTAVIENASATISNNVISLNDGWTLGIRVGNSSQGVYNCTVKENIIKSIEGKASFEGIGCYPMGEKNSIIYNDLSGLSTWGHQVSISGRNNLVQGNIFGYANEDVAIAWDVTTTALSIVSIYPHGYGDPPRNAPVEYNTIMDNDYRNCGLLGWEDDENGDIIGGCILVHTVPESEGNDFGLPNEVRFNYVHETGRFPEGTGGPKTQILVIKSTNADGTQLVHDNRIIGLSNDELVRYKNNSDLKGAFIESSQEAVLQENITARDNLIQIYPNPVSDLLNIRSKDLEDCSIKIVSPNGSVEYHQEMKGTSHQIDLSSFQKGVYFITIRSKEFVTTRKIIKL